MHMNPINFDEFCNFGDIIFEISKRQIIEKVKIFKYYEKGHLFVDLLFYDCH